MSEFKPVTTIADLEILDDDEMVEGYRAGLRGAEDQSNTKGRAWWHGWRNGMSDSRRVPSDEAQRLLCRAIVDQGDGLTTLATVGALMHSLSGGSVH